MHMQNQLEDEAQRRGLVNKSAGLPANGPPRSATTEPDFSPRAAGSSSAAATAIPSLRERTLAQLGEVTVHAAPLLAVLDAPADNPDAVADAIRRSPALTARLLSVTNSAAFRTGEPITTVHRAVIQLGAARARAVAMAFGLKVLMAGSGLPGPVAQRLWVASLQKASAARAMSQIIDPKHAEAAFCEALIQDIGLPVLLRVDPDFYQNEMVPGIRGTWLELETERFGVHHGEVGHLLLTNWEGDAELARSVLTHHDAPAGLEADDLFARVSQFLASLLPHLEEDLHGAQRDWLMMLHATFLASAYPTPEAFLEAVAQMAAPLHQNDAAASLAPGSLVRDLARGVSGDTMTMVSQLCRLETALVRQREGLDELRQHAFTDPLTKVLNRRGFLQLAERRTREAAQRNLGTCCIVLDVDDFKTVNDVHGHAAGDVVLQSLATTLRRSVDRSDIVARTGGDEFVVLMTGVRGEKAQEIAHRLVTACQGARVRVSDEVELALSVSVGAIYAAELDEEAGVEEMVNAADELMYARKRDGKGGLAFGELAKNDAK